MFANRTQYRCIPLKLGCHFSFGYTLGNVIGRFYLIPYTSMLFDPIGVLYSSCSYTSVTTPKNLFFPDYCGLGKKVVDHFRDFGAQRNR